MDEVRLTQELIRINSENPPGNEKKIAKFIKDYLEDFGIPAEMIEFGKNRFNVIGEKGKGKGLILAGHIDTVPSGDLKKWKYSPFEGKIVKGKIYGRGASDMKGGLAAILGSLRKFKNKNFKKRLVLAFVGDEEVAMKGTKYLIEKRKSFLKNVKYGVMAEPTNLDIRIAQKGITMIKLKFKGKAAHGSKPELGDNAILKASDFIQELKKLTRKLKKKKDPLLGSGTINVGKILGGTKVNIVPDYCEVEIDRRLIPGETPAIAIKQIRKILEKLNLKAKIEYLNEPRLAMKIPKNSKIVKMIQSIKKAKIKGESGYTESELYYRECGIEFVSFGPGDPKLAHVINENIKISKIKKAKKVFEKLIERWCL